MLDLYIKKVYAIFVYQKTYMLGVDRENHISDTRPCRDEVAYLKKWPN